MTELDSENENVPVVTVIPLNSEETLQNKSFEEVLTEMENKISNLEDYLRRIGEDRENEHPGTATFGGKFRDWLINTEELPIFMRPFITGHKPISNEHRSYKSMKIDLLDSQYELKTIYANVVKENFIFGAVGGMGMGYAYNNLKFPTSVYASQSDWMKDVTKIRVESNVKMMSYMTIVSRVAQRAVITGFLFDFFKRNAEQRTGKINHWSNSVGSAMICGGLFGAMRGGLKGGVIGAAGLSVSAYIWESCPTLHSVT